MMMVAGMQKWQFWFCLCCWLFSGCSENLDSSLAGPLSFTQTDKQGVSLSLFPTDLATDSFSYFSDSSTAMFIVFLMFIIPSNPPWKPGLYGTHCDL